VKMRHEAEEMLERGGPREGGGCRLSGWRGSEMRRVGMR
jgi:hypothetical protein